VRHQSPEVCEAAAAGHTILTPNAELATALVAMVERTHVHAGHDIWPTPQIREFGSWLRERYAERQLGTALPRLLTDIEERELWREVILASDVGKTFLEPAGAARAARRARHAMSEYGIPGAALADYASEESLALLQWSRAFDERCRALDCISADQVPTHEVSGVLAWIESPLWRPVARRWLAQHARTLQPTRCASLPPRRLRAASPAAELAAIAEWARQNLLASEDFRAWICVPDMTARRTEIEDAFDAALAPQRFSLVESQSPAAYAIAGGTPLSAYAPVRAALAALTATDGTLSFDAFSALLRMPELQASPADAATSAMLDVMLRTRAPSEADLATWLMPATRLAEGSAALRARAAALDGGALPKLTFVSQTLVVSGRQRLSRWVPIWVDAFERGPWAHRHRWSSSEFQAAERFRELLGQLATADHLLGERTAASAMRILQRATRETLFQPQTGIPPIWISGQLIDPWLSYDGLWVAGCSEERWPPPLDPLPLLPVRLQRAYGVIAASAESQLQLAADLQQRWQARAAASVFSCADPGDGRSSTLSPLLPAAPLELSAGVCQPHWHAQRVELKIESLCDEQAPEFASSEHTRGVATLRAQSQCAFRGFAHTRLAIEPLERPVPGFSLRERGEMVHHALEQIWSELRGSSALPAIAAGQLAADQSAADRRAADRLRDLIERSVTRAIARQCARRDPGVRWQQREAPRLTALVAQWLETEASREAFVVEQVEDGTHTVRFAGLEFDVRIDRIDRLTDGGRVLIDYKTGVVTADWRGERPDNPQLPVYALVRPEGLVAVAYGRVNASECCFVAETARPGIFKPRGRPSTLEGMSSFAELVATWSRRIETIASEFALGHAAVTPTVRACASCSFMPLCRVPSALDGAAAGPDGGAVPGGDVDG
jgi:ATP-dependent helicase/nuclease subunit B